MEKRQRARQTVVLVLACVSLGLVAASCATSASTSAKVLVRSGTSCRFVPDARVQVVYPFGRQYECERVLKGIADLRAQLQQHPERPTNEGEFWQGVLDLLNSPDGQAIGGEVTFAGADLRERAIERLRALGRQP